MDLQTILLGGGGIGLVLLTLVEITPLKLNPWSALARWLGNCFNASLRSDLAEIKTAQSETRARLERHIQLDNERNADGHRLRILQFNNELLRGIPHTHEDFIEALAEIDFYERYCHDHQDYQNNRAVYAIENIGRVYKMRLEKHDFL